MQKNPISQSGVFNPRVILAFVLCSAGAFLALASFGESVTTTTATAATAADGNWTVVRSPNATNQHLNSVTCASASDCWAVGWYVTPNDWHEEVAQTLIQHWDGNSWTIVPSPNMTARAGNYLEGVTCVSASDCWAVGNVDGPQYSALIEHWDGTSWSIVPSPHSPSHYYFVSSVACTSTTNCWAIGSSWDDQNYSVSPLFERWDGTSWSIISSPPSGYFNSITCSAATDCWAIGSAFAHWNGSSWTVVSAAPPDSYLTSVTCVSPGDCWAVGDIIEHWDGTTWATVASQSPSSLKEVTCTSATDCWAVGAWSDDNDVARTLVKHWDGSAWSVVSSPNRDNGSDNYLRSVSCTSGSECWAIGDSRKGHTLTERWNGTSWLIAASPDAAGTGLYSLFNDITCPSATDCWAVGNIFAHWDGAAWSIAPSPEQGTLSAISCASPSDCWAVGSYDNSNDYTFDTLVEHWDGIAWSIVDSPNGDEAHDNNLHDVTCTSASDCWAVGRIYDDNGGVVSHPFFEHWNGNSWTIVPAPSADITRSNYLDAVTCASASDCWAVGSYDTGNGSQTLTEHWDGLSWVIFPSPNKYPDDDNGLGSVTCVSASDCWAVGNQFQHWDGTSWMIVPSQSNTGFSDVTCTSSSNCWAIGGNVAQRWDGTSWALGELEDRPTPWYFYTILGAVACPSESRCWAVGEAWYRDETYYFVYDRTLIEQFTPKPPLTSAASRMTHGNSGTFDVDLALSGTPTVECRSGGAEGNYTIVFTFADTLTGVDDSYAYTISEPWNEEVPHTGAIGTDPHQYIVSLNGVPNGQHLEFRLIHVHDNAGNVGNFSQQMDVLIGDVNASKIVTSGDTNLCKAQALQEVTIDNFRNDINASGAITTGDVNIIKQNALSQLPP